MRTYKRLQPERMRTWLNMPQTPNYARLNTSSRVRIVGIREFPFVGGARRLPIRVGRNSYEC